MSLRLAVSALLALAFGLGAGAAQAETPPAKPVPYKAPHTP